MLFKASNFFVLFKIFNEPAPKKPTIDPQKNFLLKRAEKIAEHSHETKHQTLYRLHNGRFAVLTIYKSHLRNDSLEAVSLSSALETFAHRDISFG
jgi:hypothetical protein